MMRGPGAPVRSMTPTNIQRRKRYRIKAALEEAKKNIWSTSPTKKKAVARAVSDAMTLSSGRRQLGGLPALLDLQATNASAVMGCALRKVVEIFPPRSQGRKHVVRAAVSSSNNQDRSAIAKCIGVTKEYARRTVKLSKPSVISSATARSRSGASIGDSEGRFIEHFIRSEASAKSGQRKRKGGETLYTAQSLWRFYGKYRAESFGYYLQEATEQAAYAGEIPEEVTIHEANCWHALWKSQQPGFNMMTELSERWGHVVQEWAEKGSCGVLAERSTAKQRSGGRFDPANWQIIPRSWPTLKTFMSTITSENTTVLKGNKKRQWKGINVIPAKDTHSCPLCDKGPQQKLQLENVRSRLHHDSNLQDSLNNMQEFRSLTKKVEKYERHLKQVANQRAKTKSLEEECVQDHSKAILWRDFVSWYAQDGTKIKTLVFVLIRKGIPIYVFNVNWNKEYGNDTYFWRDAIEHLCKETSLLDDISTLYISGDHGPHFSSRSCFYYESTLFRQTKSWRQQRKDGLVLRVHFLASYHAFNRCDGAGMWLKYACTWHWREGGIGSFPRDEDDIVSMVHDGDMGRTTLPQDKMIAFAFKSINRGEDIFAALEGPGGVADKHVMPDLRTRCEVKYDWDQNGIVTRLDGVICVRDLSGVGSWEFVDTTHSGSCARGVLCVDHTRASGFPIYHEMVWVMRSRNLIANNQAC